MPERSAMILQNPTIETTPIQPQSQPPQPQPEIRLRLQAEIQLQPQPETEIQPQPQPQPQPQQELEMQQELVIVIQPEPQLEIQPQPQPEPEPEQEPQPEPEPQPQPQPQPEREPQPQPQPHPQPQQEPPNLPCGELLIDARKRDFITLCVPLYQASIKGDWAAAYAILEVHRHLVRYAITENYETPLHVAASAQRNAKTTTFVKKLVEMMNPIDLSLQNKGGETALSLAAVAGNVEIAKIMVKMNYISTTIPNNKQMMPLYTAALFRNLDMVTYLYDLSNHMDTRCGWTPTYRNWVFTKCVEADFFDFALEIVKRSQEVLEDGMALRALARKSYAFIETKPHLIWRIVNSITCCKIGPAAQESKALILLREIWKNIQEKPKTTIDRILRGPEKLDNAGKGTNTYTSRILFIAAEKDNTKFLAELLSSYPDLIWKINDDKQTIFHVAVSNRHVDIYNLLHEIGSWKALIFPMTDRQDNNMLHLVGKMATKNHLQDVSGVAFQMQRELLWFKEVESMIPPHYAERKNRNVLTPHELFTKSHDVLMFDSEKWMKGTASKCMLVATLIATIVFGVAYTIPGGYDQKNGYPMFRHNPFFIIFVVLDAISLILSSTSILVFLSILTSRYAQKDFIESLPTKLMIGITMLFVSIVTMMIAFSVSFFVLYNHKFYFFIGGSVSLLALTPVISYGVLHFPLLKDMFHSTYSSKSLFKPKKQMLYYQNPSV